MNKKVKEEGPFDLEQQYILRLPTVLADALSKDLQSGSATLKEKLSIELHNDFRHGTVRFGGQVLAGKMVDLPTIIDSLKTTDNKTFYKTGDINQMLICSTEVDSPDESEGSRRKERDKKYQWNHGITPPLKNVRKRRFRKVSKKKYLDMPEIEKEVKRLFREDAEALKVKYEIIADDDTPVVIGTDIKTELGESELFGDLSSDEEGSDRSPEKSANFTYSDTDEASRAAPEGFDMPMPEESVASAAAAEEDNHLPRLGLHLSDHEEPSSPPVEGPLSVDPPFSPEGPCSSPPGAPSPRSEDDEQLLQLQRELNELRERQAAEQAKIGATDNPALKRRFAAILQKLEEEVEEKEQEILSLT